MRQRYIPVLLLSVTALLASCEAIPEGMAGHSDIVAVADGFKLTVDHAAELLASASEEIAPTSPRVVDPLAELWINYTLLAVRMANPNGLDDSDLSLLAQPVEDQALVWNLHTDVILAKAVPSEAEVQAAFEAEQPLIRARARHILVRVPRGASAAEDDSVRRYVEGIRQQALAGIDFGDLATRYSQDPATSPEGGSLGWIDRGRLVPELEEVVFAMAPGEISEVVSSEFGYHILQVTEREEPEFFDAQQAYYGALRDGRVAEYEEAYIDSLLAAGKPRIVHGAERRAKRLAFNPHVQRLSKQERDAPLVRYSGGAVTVGEFAQFIVRGAPNSRNVVGGADEQGIADILMEMVRSELLVKAAKDLGYTVSPERADSAYNAALREMSVAAVVSGMDREILSRGDRALTVEVDKALVAVLSRARSPRGVDRVFRELRDGHAIQVYSDRYAQVAAKLAELRSSRR